MDVPITKDLTGIEHEQSSKHVTYNVDGAGVQKNAKSFYRATVKQ